MIIKEAKQLKADLVSAAAPNLNFAKDLFEPELVRCAIESIIVAPKLQQPQTSALVLGDHELIKPRTCNGSPWMATSAITQSRLDTLHNYMPDPFIGLTSSSSSSS
eukprot:4913570-Amphidinium_carterae.1